MSFFHFMFNARNPLNHHDYFKAVHEQIKRWHFYHVTKAEPFHIITTTETLFARHVTAATRWIRQRLQEQNEGWDKEAEGGVRPPPAVSHAGGATFPFRWDANHIRTEQEEAGASSVMWLPVRGMLSLTHAHTRLQPSVNNTRSLLYICVSHIDLF